MLVVEDDASLRELYRSVLTAAGYAVNAVEDGIDALRRLETVRPDIIVLDLILPRLSGRDVQQELAAHAETRSIPILAVTATDTRALDAAAFACVLHKPIRPHELVAAVAECLQRSP